MIEWVTGVVASGGLLGVGLLMFLENLFPPIPSEVIMPLAGFVAARGELSFTGIILAGVVGTVLGNAVWFELARAIGADRLRPLADRFGPWFAVMPEDIRKAEATLRHYGPVALFFGRLLPGIRTVISIPAGLVHIPRNVFYVWTTLGSLIWVSFLAAAGLVLKENYAVVEGWLEPLAYAVVAFAVGGYAWHLLRAWRRRSRPVA